MTQIQTAAKLFDEGFACSQSILGSFCEDFGLDRKIALKLTDPFGAGMRGQSETCGTVTGALMVIGLKYGRTRADDLLAKEAAAELAQEFVKRFKERHGTIVCKALLGYDISIPEQHDIAEELGYFKTKCPNFVRDAAEILEQIL
jgi:C_GCAxxG_C_C family probable redox protein